MTENIFRQLFFSFTNHSVSLKDVGLDEELHKGVWIWQGQKEDNRPDTKDGIQRLIQPRQDDKMVSRKFIARR